MRRDTKWFAGSTGALNGTLCFHFLIISLKEISKTVSFIWVLRAAGALLLHQKDLAITFLVTRPILAREWECKV